MKSALSALSYIIESTKKVYFKKGKGMDRMAEVKERLKSWRTGMISCPGVSEFMMAAGLILAEDPGADSIN